MRLSRFHAPTLRDAPKEAELVSHALLLRAGFVRQLAAGIYTLLPLGVRTLRKIAAIVREELERAGAVEVLMPAIQPASLWKQSGRWDKYGPELLRLEDRKGNEFCVGPTHEEVIVDLVRRDVKSYRQLPLNLYQVQSKFRDEVRPRGGIIRAREFMMKDAYSFDADAEAAEKSYKDMFDAYHRIFERCGLDFRAVEADTGNIGGNLSHEFQALASSGEDAIVSCDSCEYTANTEKAAIGPVGTQAGDIQPGSMSSIATPGKRTVQDVTTFLGASPSDLLKTLIVDIDGVPTAAIVRGDHELNTIKLKLVLGADSVELAGEERVRKITGAPVGFAGPVGLEVPLIVDASVDVARGWIVGGNAADLHHKDAVLGRDTAEPRVLDIRLATHGDPCPRCNGSLREFRGIEVGHVFYLGTKYSEPMDLTFASQDGGTKPMIMGCYGIGISRIMAATIEQHHDDKGIRWPASIAPFEVAVLPLGKPGDDVFVAAEEIYNRCCHAGIDALFDDRKGRAGVKFADAELAGHPYQIVLGRNALADNVVELKSRATGETERVAIGDLVEHVKGLLAAPTGTA